LYVLQVSSMVQEIYDMPPRAVVGAFQECLAGKQQQQQHQPQEDYQQHASIARAVELERRSSNSSSTVPAVRLVAG
jgi:hypothetical protein